MDNCKLRWRRNINELPFFHDTDKKERFYNNINLFGENWIYRYKYITYDLNEQGFRMNEFTNIDWDNYVLFLGCSNTFGTGLSLEDTFSYKYANHLNKDVVNLGLCGGSNDAMFILLNKIIEMGKKPPHAVVINWSHSARYVDRRTYRSYLSNDLKSHKNKKFKDFIIKGKEYHFKRFLHIRRLMLNKIKQTWKTVPHEISLFEENEYKNIKFFNTLDLARDRMHSGIETNKSIYEYLIHKKEN